MTDKSIAIVKKLAKELLELIKTMEDEEKTRISTHGNYCYPSPKNRGSVRRKSMDLTRALADMRKPN